MENLFAYLLALATVTMFAIPPTAQRWTRRLRIVIAYLLLHPLEAAILLGCKEWSSTDCGIDMTWRLGGGSLLWGWLFAVPFICGLEAIWRLVYFRKLKSFTEGVGDDETLNMLLTIAFTLTLLPWLLIWSLSY